MNTEKTDFTQGSILKKLSLFMLPVLGARRLPLHMYSVSTRDTMLAMEPNAPRTDKLRLLNDYYRFLQLG